MDLGFAPPVSPSWATQDNMILGWSDEEYQATGASRHRRGQRAAEFVEVLRTLWQDDVATHSGEFYRIPSTRMEPKPVQRPHPPILLRARGATPGGPARRRLGQRQ